MNISKLPSIDIITLHPPGDARVYEREARSLSKYCTRLRLIAPSKQNHVPNDTDIEFLTVLVPRNRIETFLITPIRLLLKSRIKPSKVVYIQDAILLYLLPIFRLFGQQCIYDIHEDYPNMVMRRSYIPIFLRKLTRIAVYFYEQLFGRFATGITAAVYPLEKAISGKHGVVIRNFPTMKTITQGLLVKKPIDEREFDIVHLGVISGERFTFFIDILDILIKKNPNIKCMIIGLRDEYIHKIKSRIPNINVLIYPWLPHEKVLRELSRCKIGIGVWPVLYTHLKPAIPVKMFEYMAAGCCIVTSHMPGFENLLRPEDISEIEVVNTNEPSFYADKILDTLGKSKELIRRSEHLQSIVVDYYSWEKSEEIKLIDYFYMQTCPK